MTNSAGWVQPRENSIEAITYGMQVSDGVEFDLRLTEDDRLVLHHDSKTEFGDYPESMKMDELPDYVETLDELLEDKNFIKRWTEEGAFSCIELKPPHPSSGKAGGWIGGKSRELHMIKMIQKLEESLESLNLGESSTIIYSFEPKLISAAKKIGSEYKFSIIRPYIRQWGTWQTQRIAAIPSFLSNSLPRLIDKQRREGSPMLPCSMQYLKGVESRVNFGMTVGLRGKKLERLNKYRRGYPIYVWPCKSIDERLLLDAGLTGITDHLSPELVTLDTGHARWTKPSTQPLTDKKRQELDNAPEIEHKDLVSEFSKEIAPWHELSNKERIDFLTNWSKKWEWERSIETIMKETSDTNMPWEVSRIIGHRGTGKTHSK
jgi:hypothetical protein